MKTFKNNLIALSYVYRFCPLMVIFAVFFVIASVVLAVSKIYLIANAIDLVISGADIHILFNSLFIFLIVIIVTSFFRTYYNNFISTRYRTIYIKKMQQFLFAKVKNIDMENFDNPDFYDNFSRALRDGIFRGIRVFEELVRFITAIVTTLAIGAIIILNDPILILIIMTSAIINIFVVSTINKKWYLWSKETEPDRRMYHYINRTFYRQRFAGEIKTTQISDLLIKKYRKSAKVINKKYAKTYKKVTGLQTIFHGSKAFIEQGASYAYLTFKLFTGMPISIFTATINATIQFSNNFVDAIQFLVQLKEHSYYINDFLWLVEYIPKLEDKKGQLITEISDVSTHDIGFQYPESDFYQLSELHLSLHKGEKIAIVGPNGSGKTTLTKLLLNFYLPSMGFITANNIEYTQLDVKDVRKKYAVIFQDFQIYALTIAENVLMRKLNSKEDEKTVWQALEQVGMKEKITDLPKGINTQVTREFTRQGAVFSGGEIQRIAIARVFASEADIYILDEPTSSLDPLSEERINKLILKNTKKAMIIIAHRLSTVVEADKIYLIDQGRIVESGSHQDMLKLNGLYAKMFSTQKSLYQKH